MDAYVPSMNERSHPYSTDGALPDEWFPIGTAAKILGVSVATVRRWADDGKLPSVRTLGGQRRFRRSDLDAALKTAS